MHHIYHTRGIILGSVPIGGSNRFYKILTEDLGLVGASAQAVREGKSKLRYALQDFSQVSVDLVQGKEVWRITSAAEEMPYPRMKADVARLRLFARACALVQRLVHGEGREDALLADICGAAQFLEKESVPPHLEMAFEALAVFRALALLGYLYPAGHERFVELGTWSADMLKDFETIRVATTPRINDALHASQL